ncbi:MAG TPA: hypothetical protein VMU60_00255 [Syntrophobacteria bacterium]|nr:hypothetical protein [Syntrophobacteria bacterium]
MKKAVILIAFLLMLPCPALAEWQWVSPRPTGEDLIDWSNPAPGLHIVLGTNGFIMKSYDDGSTWTGAYVEGAQNLTAIFFLNGSVGYGLTRDPAGGNGSVVKTVDGGVTWQVNYEPDPRFVYLTFTGLFFIDQDRGFATAYGYDPYQYRALLFSTVDGGQHWSVQGLEWCAGKIFFVNESLGFIVGGSGHYYKSTDGGTTWVLHLMESYGGDISDLRMVDSQMGYAVVSRPDFAGTLVPWLFKTTDGGETWWPTGLLALWPYSLAFGPDGVGVVLTPGGIYRTVDEGETFQKVMGLTGYPEWENLVRGTNGTLFAFGNQGLLLRSSDNGATWADGRISAVAPGDILETGLFTSPRRGYLFGGSAIYTYEKGAAGETWTKSYTNPGALGAFSFPTNEIGYAVGDRVLKTVDGGTSWSEVFNLSAAGLRIPQFQGVQFVTPEIGYAGYLGWVGWYKTPTFTVDPYGCHSFGQCPPAFYITRDGGSTWTDVGLPIYSAFSYQLIGFRFPSPTVGYAARSTVHGIEIWRITDRGESEGLLTELIYNASSPAIDAIYFKDDSNWLAASGGTLYRTANSGATWELAADLASQLGVDGVSKFLYDQEGQTWWILTSDSRILKGGSDGSTWSLFSFPGTPADIILHPYGLWAFRTPYPGDLSEILKYERPGAGQMPPAPPVNLEPVDGTALTQTPVVLKASQFTDPNPGDTHGASQWQVATDAVFTAIALDSAPDPSNLTTYTVGSGLTYTQPYYFRVRYQDSTGLWSDWSQPTRFLLSHPPERPSLNAALLPKDSVFYTTTPTLVFSDYRDQDGDPQRGTEVRVSRGANCDDLLWGQVFFDPVTRAFVPAGLLEYGSTYCVQVRYRDGNMLWSDWSAPERIKVSNGPQQPLNARPAAEAEIDSVQLEASAFSDAFAAQQASQWQICRGEDFLCMVFDGETTGGDLVRFTPPNVFLADRTYSWRVRYRNAHGVWSPWSQPTSFTFVPFL